MDSMTDDRCGRAWQAASVLELTRENGNFIALGNWAITGNRSITIALCV